MQVGKIEQLTDKPDWSFAFRNREESLMSVVESIEPKTAITVINPTEDDMNDPLFQAILQAIKGWDIQRAPGHGYAGANGSDAMTILAAIRSANDR